MNFRLRTETWTGLLLLLALLLPVGIYAAAYRAGRQLSASLGGASHSQEVMLAIDQVQLQMVRAMNAERQYQLAGDPGQLQAYQLAVAQTRSELADLRRLTRDTPREKPALDQLAAAAGNQIRNLEQNAAAPAPAAGGGASLEALRSAQAVRSGAEASMAEEQHLLNERRAIGAGFLRRWSRLFRGGVIASVVLLVIVFVLLVREVRRRRCAQVELNRSHLQLQASWQHYDNLIAHVPAAVWSASADGRIAYLSSYMETLTGYTPLEIVSADAAFWHAHLHPDDLVGAMASWRELFARHGATALEFRMRHRQGHWIWLQAQGRTTGGVGPQARADGVLYDITAVKHRAELEMRERGFQFKNDVLASVSHELRTPLSAILGFSDLLAQGAAGPLSRDQRDFARHIHASGEHLLALINDILDLSRIEAGQLRLRPERVELARAAEEAVEIVAAQAQDKGVALRSECADGIAVRADPLRLRQIFCNLLGNAVKFTPAGGGIAVLAAAEGDWARVTVLDNGIGIPPEHLDTIVDRFRQVESTARQAGEGTGLGLAITRHLVTSHGGRIWAESRPGAGSAFHFTLPTAEAVSSTNQANAAAG
jgi:PAS domain S-box-containing protein